MSTGNERLDAPLGGGIEQGQFYLFYGNEDSGIDYLIHRLLISCLLPTEKGMFWGKSVYTNCGNHRREKTTLDIRLLCYLAKEAGLEPLEALDKIYVICSFSMEQQEQFFKDIKKLVGEDPEVKLVAVHNIAKLFAAEGNGRNVRGRIIRLQKVIHNLWRIRVENDMALITSHRPIGECRGIPKPKGGEYLSHKATTIVYFEMSRKDFSSVHLIKHPFLPQKRIDLKFKICEFSLGRVTHSFRTVLREEIDNLKKTYREVLMDIERREAFGSLIHVWSSEEGAMSYARIPTVLDVTLLTAIVDDRRLIIEISGQVEALRSILERINAKLD